MVCVAVNIITETDQAKPNLPKLALFVTTRTNFYQNINSYLFYLLIRSCTSTGMGTGTRTGTRVRVPIRRYGYGYQAGLKYGYGYGYWYLGTGTMKWVWVRVRVPSHVETRVRVPQWVLGYWYGYQFWYLGTGTTSLQIKQMNTCKTSNQ